MKDACIIRRKTGDTPDPDNKLKRIPIYDTIYTGKCKLQQGNAGPNEATVPGQSLAVQSPELHLPLVGSEDVLPGDVAEITAVDPVVGDPALIGRKYTVKGVAGKSFATARRLPVESLL